MSATSRPTPGSAAALLDVAVRSVTEGRYRMAHLHLMWQQQRIDTLELADLVNHASTIAALPPGLSAAHVLEHGKPDLLPTWLEPVIDAEISRICAGLPAAANTPIQVVGRLAAAVCVDVCADIADASARAADPDAESTVRRSRMIHLELPDRIELDGSDLGATETPHGQGSSLS
jgi:hypothetical protein